MRSVHDHELSVQARFEQTMDKIDKIEYSINELANRIDRGMIHQTEMTNVFFKKIDEMTSQHIEMKKTNEKMSEIVTVNGERSEKIAKQAKEMSDAYWKSVAFAEDGLRMIKEIKEKLL
jgi:hypothetical protein